MALVNAASAFPRHPRSKASPDAAFVPPCTDPRASPAMRRWLGRRTPILRGRPGRVDPARLDERARALRVGGQRVILIALDGKPAGVIAVADPIKPSARAAI